MKIPREEESIKGSVPFIKKRQIIALEHFIGEHKCPYGLVTNNGDQVYKLSSKVYQLPAIFL
jgi:hypothetical protein